MDKCDQLTAVLEALLYTESGGGAPLKDIDQVNYLVWIKCDQLTAVLEALLYTESGGGASLKDIDQVNYLVWISVIS